MKPTRVRSIYPYDWSAVLGASQSEGHNMVNRLLTDFRAGENRFDAPGERLFVHLSGNGVLAVAGLNREPDGRLPFAGRVRRLYVAPDCRGRGLGRSLVTAIIAAAEPYFKMLTVNVGKLDSWGFYEHLGFTPDGHPNITHTRKLAQNH
jgi:GNAT superfamily N-acetyltransferase